MNVQKESICNLTQAPAIPQDENERETRKTMCVKMFLMETFSKAHMKNW